MAKDMQYRAFEPMNYYQVDGDGLDDFAYQPGPLQSSNDLLNLLAQISPNPVGPSVAAPAPAPAAPVSVEELIAFGSPSEFAGVQGTGGFPYGVSDTPGLHGLPEAQRIALNDAENQARIAQKAAIRQKMDELGANMFVSGMGYAPEGEFGGFTSAPVAPPVAPPQVFSQPDDFNMLRRMQEFRETVPVAPPQQFSDDSGLIPKFSQFYDEVAPRVPPTGLPQLISQDEGLRPRMPESEITTAAPLSEARISDDAGLIPRVATRVAKGLPALPAAQQTSAIDKMTQQILGQGTTSKWTGTGFGSAEANARGMAEQLAKYGLTDISQFGTKIVDVPERREVATGGDESGGYEYEVIHPAHQKRIFYNKATGQEINPDYSRSGGNIWSGTFAGKGSTGFGVEFDEAGNPYFYTQYGGSTSDWTQTVRPALQFLANTVGMVTPLAPYIAAANALNAAKKGDWEAAILSALPAAGQIAGSLGASAQTVSALQTANQAARVLNALDKGDLLGAALGGANLAGISNIAGIDLKDVTKAVNIAKAIESGNPLAIMQAGTALAGGTGTAEKEPPDQGTGGDLGYYPGQGEEDGGDDYQDELLRQIGIDPKTTGEVATPTNREILDSIGYTPVQSESELTPEEVRRILTQPVNEDIQPYKDEMDRYVEYLMRTQTDEVGNVIEPTSPEYNVQNIPITPENFQSFDENLVKMLEEGRLPSQFVKNDDGTYTMTSDDGSTITIDKDGNVLDVFAAPEDTDFHQVIVGERLRKDPLELITSDDDARIEPTPISIPKVVEEKPTPKKPTPKTSSKVTGKTSAKQTPDLSALLALLGGQGQGPIPLVVPENRADIELMEDIYGTSLSAPSTGNANERAEELARLLRS
jgi:hypothetical protein